MQLVVISPAAKGCTLYVMHAAVEGPFVLNALHRKGCHVRVKFAIQVSVAKTLVHINLGYRNPVLIYF